MKERVLEISYTISKARDTYGYNVVTLREGAQKFKCSGGGYDMLGTVFAEWLENNYMESLKTLKPYSREQQELRDFDNYGLFACPDGSLRLDGGCGIESIKRIAKAIGLEVSTIYSKGSTSHIIVKEGE